MLKWTWYIKKQNGYPIIRSFTRWFGDREKSADYENAVEGLKMVYRTKLLPLEKKYLFHEFHSPQLYDSDFDANPLILLMGQYSTGKTTFIRYIIGRDFPGMRIGPEPTTDRFITLMHGTEEQEIPGNALVVDPKRQFRPLAKFGNNFLNRFQCSLVNSDVLKYVSIIDTPGILSGEKQRVDRGYDFPGVLHWFSERVDRIILLFDANKLDISDEFRRCIEVMRAQDEKIRIVLNKADHVSQQQLMRVYGALMWSLGKIFQTPETARVYIGSFWEKPLLHDENRRLFEEETRDLFLDLRSLPRNAVLRKINDLSRRARLAKVHAYIIGTLQSKMPAFFGKEKTKLELINNLDSIYIDLQNQHQIPAGDFPELEKMKSKLQEIDFDRFDAVNTSLLKSVDSMLAEDIAKLMQMLPKESPKDDVQQESKKFINGGAFRSVVDGGSPFGFGGSSGIHEGKTGTEWIVEKFRKTSDDIFAAINSKDGKVSRSDARLEMLKSKLPSSVLGKVWLLADVDEDGLLDKEEFALAMYLIQLCLEGHDLPAELPTHLVPPKKRVVEVTE